MTNKEDTLDLMVYILKDVLKILRSTEPEADIPDEL